MCAIEISFLYQNKAGCSVKEAPFLWCFFNVNIPRIWIFFPSQQVNTLNSNHAVSTCQNTQTRLSIFLLAIEDKRYKPLFFCVLYTYIYTMQDMDIQFILCISLYSFYICVTCCITFTIQSTALTESGPASINCAARGHPQQYFSWSRKLLK